jgi:hypothetical protein
MISVHNNKGPIWWKRGEKISIRSMIATSFTFEVLAPNRFGRLSKISKYRSEDQDLIHPVHIRIGLVRNLPGQMLEDPGQIMANITAKTLQYRS